MSGVIQFDMALAQKMMQASTKTVHDMLRIPGDDENLGVDEIVKQHNAQYPQNLLQELQQARADVEATEQQIRQYREQLTRITGDKFEQNNRFATVRPKLLSKLRALLQLFPEKQHEYILGLFVDKEYLQRTLQGSMGVVDKVFRSKKILGDFDVLYDEVRKLMDSIGVSTPSAMEIDRELGTRLSDMDDEIKKINSEIETAQHRLADYKIQLQTAEDKHNKLSVAMHKDVADFLHAFRNRKQLRKQIPMKFNMQGLTEPVAFFQTLSGSVDPSEVRALLRAAGLSVGYEPGQYIVHESADIDRNTVYELITPFYSPQVAHDNIEALMGYLAEHGVDFKGVIKPATYSQIAPRAERQVSRRRAESLIWKKLSSGNRMTRDDFLTFYRNGANRGKFLFRGQTFATADPSSSYATPTWRPGRTGLVYATESPSDATSYATNTGGKTTNGLTMMSDIFFRYDGDIVGVVSVFEKSGWEFAVSDKGLETYTTMESLLQRVSGRENDETIVSPVNNPLVARYLIIGTERMLKIDENDPEWHEILDALAPDLSVTHRGGLPGWYKIRANCDTHGLNFLGMLEKLRLEVAEHGKLQTHDISPEQMEYMGFQKKSTAHFDPARQKITGRTPSANMVDQNTLE